MAKVVHILVGCACAGGAGEQSLQGVAHLLDLERLTIRDQPDPRATVGLADDEALLVERREGRPNRGTTRSEMNGQVRLDQPFVRLKAAADDLLAKPAAHLGARVSMRRLHPSGG